MRSAFLQNLKSRFSNTSPTKMRMTILVGLLSIVNCALVCKAWTGHARSHLYYAANINGFRGLSQLERLCKYTHLRPFLQEFTWPRESMLSLNASDADIIKDISPTVTQLRFRGVDHRCLEPRLQEAMSTFTKINKLDMTGSIFQNWTAVVRVVSSFPLLATLAMPITSTCQDDDGFNGPRISYPPPPGHLVHITLASGCEAETVSWIRKGPSIPNIQTVEVESKIDSKVLAKLLRSLGGRLRHLIIHIDSNRACSQFRLLKTYLIEHHSWREYLGSISILLSPHRKYCP